MLESTISPNQRLRIWYENLKSKKILGHGSFKCTTVYSRLYVYQYPGLPVSSTFFIPLMLAILYPFVYCMPKYCLCACVSLCPFPRCTRKMDGFSDAEIRRKTRKMARAEVWRPRLCWIFVNFCTTSGLILRAALTTRHTTNFFFFFNKLPRRKRNTRDEPVQNFTQHDDVATFCRSTLCKR